MKGRYAALVAGALAAASPTSARAQAPAAAPVWGPHASLRGGYAFRVLYGVPVDAGEVGLAAGVRYRWLSLQARFDALQGATREGLVVDTREGGLGAEAALGALRLGLSATLGAIHVARATKLATLSGLTLGVRGRVAYDLLRWSEDGALWAGVEATAATVGDGAFYGPSVLFGVRAL